MDDLATIPVIAQKAQLLAMQMAAPAGGAPVPPNLITFLQQVFAALISFLQGCGQTPAAAVQTSQNPGPFARLRVRRTTRQELSVHPDLAAQYSQAALEAGVWQIAAGTSEAEFTAAYHQLGN